MDEKMEEKFREEYKSCSTRAFNYYVEGYFNPDENDAKKCLALAQKYKDQAYMYGKQLGLTKEEIDQDCIFSKE